MAIFQKQHKINMGKYIDVEKLKAEIERLNSLVSYESKDRHDEGLHDAYKAVKNVIASLQQEQDSVAERFARIVRGNLIGIDKEVQQKFEQLYFEVTGNKMYGGYND